MNSIPQNPNCFELFGYDIIIDEQLKCWLLEVNSSPSLEKDFIIDEILKQQLIDDVIEVVQPVKYDRERLKIIV
jgi:tubulin polyglutamylase TTLL5